MKINIYYAAGLLERMGGFAVHKNPQNQKYYRYFKIATFSQAILDVMNFLEARKGIDFQIYKIQGRKVFYVTNEAAIERLIKFMKKYCYRTDYRRFKKTKTGYRPV